MTDAAADIAEVLARRGERGRICEDDALMVAKQWFYDNPKELYGLKG